MKLSIIVPVYNTEKYLEKCLNSLLLQINMQDEVILINDASVDNSLLICKKYAEKYNNIILINNKINKGIGYVRNLGLKYATGDYIIWIDSDDWVSKEYLLVIRRYLEKTNVDIFIFDYSIINNKEEKYRTYRNKSGFISKKEIMLDVAQDSFFSLLWRTIVKKDIYTNIRFPENLSIMEDFYIYHELFYKAKTFFYLKKSLYFYQVVKNSLSRKKEQNFYLIYKTCLHRENFIKKNCPYIEEMYRMVPVVLSTCMLRNINYLSKEEKNRVCRILREHIKFFVSRKYINNRKKIQMLIYMISPNLLYYIRKVLKK